MVTTSSPGKRRARQFKPVQHGIAYRIFFWLGKHTVLFLLLAAGCVIAFGLVPRSPLPVPQVAVYNQEKNIPVYVLDNGVHIDLALPMYQIVTLPQGKYSINYSKLFGLDDKVVSPAFLPSALEYPPLTSEVLQHAASLWESQQPRSLGNAPSPPIAVLGMQRWCIVGWGQLDFYQTTPTWSDLRISTAVKAALGAEAALHVYYYLGDLIPDEDSRLLMLSEDEYIALFRHITASLRTDAAGNPMPVHGSGYGMQDKFFLATGIFSGMYTCNSWASDALRTIGRPTPFWTITPWFIMHHLAP